jgi:hypothetical protein
MKHDRTFRLEQTEEVGLGFDFAPRITDVVRIVRKIECLSHVENAA